MFELEIILGGELVPLVRASCHEPVLQCRRLLPEATSVKDAIEALGIPHGEVGRVTTGGRELDLDARLERSRTITVEPAGPRRLDPVLLLCDHHLGKLARLLRCMGFDTTWNPDWTEPEVARRATNEGRAVLSRSRSLLKRRTCDPALLVRSDRPDDQAAEVVRRFELADRIDLWGRCSLCNGRLHEVAKADVAARIPPRTARWLDTYYVCAACDHLYWEGTHVIDLRRRIEAIVRRARTGSEP